jgi:hypothetical protein
MDTVTMTPEFGPDGYLHLLPFTRQPVAGLWELNVWMGGELRRKMTKMVIADPG